MVLTSVNTCARCLGPAASAPQGVCGASQNNHEGRVRMEQRRYSSSISAQWVRGLESSAHTEGLEGINQKSRERPSRAIGVCCTRLNTSPAKSQAAFTRKTKFPSSWPLSDKIYSNPSHIFQQPFWGCLQTRRRRDVTNVRQRK